MLLFDKGTTLRGTAQFTAGFIMLLLGN